MNKNLSEILKDKKLSAIIFILDYLQIQFDNTLITFLAYPKVEVKNENFSFGENEYRNKICEFIGKKVSSVTYTENKIFCLDFDEGRICISIAPEDYESPEMIIIDDGGGNTIVF